MKVLISTMPYVGHFNPTQPIAIELVRRGHEVVWVTDASYREKVKATGARFEPMADEAVIRADAIDPEPGTTGIARTVSFLQKIFLDRIPAQVADYRHHLETFPADILLVEFCTFGAQTMNDLTGLPYATLGINPLVTMDPEIPSWGFGWQPPKTFLGRWLNMAVHFLAQRLLYSKMEVVLDEKRRVVGAGPMPAGLCFQNAIFSRYGHIMMTTPMLEFPRKNLAPYIKFVGPLLPAVDKASFAPPGWWEELLAHPRERVVHVTQGTLDVDQDNLIRPTILALASQDDLLVIVTGKKIDNMFGEELPLPANVRTAAFVPHVLLLPHVGVMVTNGGYQGVLTALSHGVPLVCAGRSEDKADTNSRVAWSGAGIDLSTDKPTVSAVRGAVRKIIADRKYREAAGGIMRDFATHNGPAEAADILEKIAEENKGWRDGRRSGQSSASQSQEGAEAMREELK